MTSKKHGLSWKMSLKASLTKQREEKQMSNKNANIGARLDRLPNSGWHIKMWLVSAFALLVCWSNGIGGAVQNVLLNELHWLEPGSTLLAMWEQLTQQVSYSEH